MNVMCVLLVVSVCTTGSGLDEARMLLRRGLLRDAEERLTPMLANESDVQGHAHVLLLLGNVAYERGRYARAVELYLEAELEALAEPMVAAAARDNRVMSEDRLGRSRELGVLATRLRAAMAATGVLAGVVVAWLARRPRTRGSATPARR